MQVNAPTSFLLLLCDIIEYKLILLIFIGRKIYLTCNPLKMLFALSLTLPLGSIFYEP